MFITYFSFSIWIKIINGIKKFHFFVVFTHRQWSPFFFICSICRQSNHLENLIPARPLVTLRLISWTVCCIGMDAGLLNKEQRINWLFIILYYEHICFENSQELVIYLACWCCNLELTRRICTIVASSSTAYTTLALAPVFTCTTYL